MHPLQICLFDDRRGEVEGEESDKLLGYYPTQVSAQAQTAFVGLVQAIVTFCRTFQDEVCSVVNTEQSRWVLHRCEPHIWLVLTVDQSWHKGLVNEDGLQACIAQLHQIISLLHGPIQNLLSKDDTGSLARKAVADVVAEFGERLSRKRGLEYSNLHNPLSAIRAAPMLKLPTPCFLSMQSLVNRLLVSPAWGGAPVTGLMLLHEHWLTWSTLTESDSQSLYQFYRWVLLPAIRASNSYFGTRFSNVRDARAAQALCNRGSWHQDSNGAQYLMGTFNHVASPGSQEAHQIPSVWMQVRILLNDVNRIEHQGSQEWCSLLVVRVGEQLLMLLLPEGASVTPTAIEACLATATPLMKRLNTSVSQHVQQIRRMHVPTFRYLFVDEVLSASQASPGSKVATLSRQSLELVHSVRSALDADSKQDQEGQFREIAIRGEHDCWVVGKAKHRKSLLVALEQHGTEGLREAMKSVDAFADEHFAGLI